MKRRADASPRAKRAGWRPEAEAMEGRRLLAANVATTMMMIDAPDGSPPTEVRPISDAGLGGDAEVTTLLNAVDGSPPAVVRPISASNLGTDAGVINLPAASDRMMIMSMVPDADGGPVVTDAVPIRADADGEVHILSLATTRNAGQQRNRPFFAARGEGNRPLPFFLNRNGSAQGENGLNVFLANRRSAILARRVPDAEVPVIERDGPASDRVMLAGDGSSLGLTPEELAVA